MSEGQSATSVERDDRLVAVDLDSSTIAPSSPEIEQDRAVAIRDLVDENHFAPVGRGRGPFALRLSLDGRRLVFAIDEARGDRREEVAVHILSLTPFGRIIRDYDAIRSSYIAAVRDGATGRIEAIDMGRRGVHNEGSELLQQRLDGKIEVDFDTARRLFTLVCALGDGVAGRGPQL